MVRLLLVMEILSQLLILDLILFSPNVLVVTKNLLSISKLTYDFPVDVHFTNAAFEIQNRVTKNPLAQERLDHGLYVLHKKFSALFVALRSKGLKASFDI